MGIPLGNKKIKEAVESSRSKAKAGKRLKLNGKSMNSNMVHLIEKLDEIESIEKLRKHRETTNEEEDEYLHGRTNMLKKEQERLSTAFQTHSKAEFNPIGRKLKYGSAECN